jgi:4-hydroxy-tetrahydrodipicolinate synthase
MITGSLVAITTPMFDDGSLDFDSYRKLIDWHIEKGTNGIVAVGTTGESPTVDVDEHLELIRVAVEQTAGRIPVIAGTGANSTLEAIELTREAAALGAQASLQVVPYNVPGRTVADLAHETTLLLAQIPNIIGIKDATGNIERGTWLIREAPAGFAIYSGDDGTAAALMLMGGHGNISVTANVVPDLMSKLCALAMAGNAQETSELQRKLLPLHRAMFIEANPIPVKWALARMGRSKPGIRLPLVALSKSNESVVESALKNLGVIS